MIAGYMYWFPKAFGFRLSEVWGKVAFVCWVSGFYLAFMPLYVLGLGGMARRSQALFEPDYRPWLIVAACGAVLLLSGLVSLFVQLFVSVRDRDANRVPVGDPWDARGLEWSVAAPPPEYNFATIPRVDRLDPFYWLKERGEAYRAPSRYEDIVMPKVSWVGPLVGLAAAACAFGLVWHIGWLSLVGFLGISGFRSSPAASCATSTARSPPPRSRRTSGSGWSAPTRCVRCRANARPSRPISGSPARSRRR